ncbi:MAG: flagellar biosynthesis protein FlhA [Syntrophomonadaceae bacterium]|nr:flagellar biosynthesis protein FlhA [Syntrophomonadaceae bacterium]
MVQYSNNILKNFKLRGNSDIIVAAAIVAIVGIIIIPMPTPVLDVLLACSLASGLIMLLMSLFITEPLQMSIFPTLLLVVTLFRLSLDISATRCILNNADAGEIIDSFGKFVVGGNYVVGAVIFLIITLVQFVVITNGAGRTAEVAARFALDAMPGKQMSIDADLSAGMITEQEAKERRLKLQREASFFGSMDGASKFVKGDAIAGIGIALINIIGGIIIGTWQKGMPAVEAMQIYTLLTIGEGLVAQIPALLASTATGIIVTRAETGHSFGLDLSGQIGKFPRAIGLASGILLVLAIIPGLPFLPFIILSGGMAYIAYTLNKEEVQNEQIKASQESTRPASREPENILNLFRVDPLEIEIGYNLISLIDENNGGDLLNRLAAVRKQCALEMGIYVRPIRIRDNLQLNPNVYRFKIRGVDITGGELMPNYYLAMNPDDNEAEIDGLKTVEPTFGLPAWWIREENKEMAEMESFTVVDASTVLITHLTEFIKSYAHEILSRQDVQDLLDMVKQNNEALVNDLVPNQLLVGDIQKVIQSLLKEKISIRDLETILEALADAARISKNTDYLVECSRQALMRNISKQYSVDGKITIVTIDSLLESQLSDSIQNSTQGSYPAISPDLTQYILEQLEKLEKQFILLGLPMVIVCSSRVRLPLRRLIERFKPQIAVLAINELNPDLDVEIKGSVMSNEH